MSGPRAVVACAAAAFSAYAALALAASRLGPWHEHLGAYWALHAVAWTAMYAAARTRIGARTILAGAIAFRALFVPLAPSLSDDLYRYVWEGRVQNAGWDPYLHAPDAPELTPLRDALWAKVNHREYAAIYPPFAELAFRGLARLGGVTTFKACFAALDVLTVVLLLRARRGRSPAPVVWYAWNPLAVVEVAASGHFEPLGLLPLVVAITAAEARRMRGWAGFAASLGVKYAGIVTLPALVRHARPSGRAAAVAALVLVAGFALYAPAGWHLFDSLRVYAEHWRYNDFAFAWLRGHVQDPLRARRIAAIAACLAAAATAVGSRSLAGGAIAALCATLLVMPTVHAWYLLWPLVLLPLCPSRAVLVWSATMPLAYHFAHPAFGRAAPPDTAWGWRWLEMAPVLLALVSDGAAWARGRRSDRRRVGAPTVAAARTLAHDANVARVALVMPALDEEPSLPLVLGDLEPLRRDRPAPGAGAVLDEIVVVDNGSRDRTAEIARRAGCTVLQEPARGYGAACLRALAHLRAAPPDVVVFMDADRSDDAAEIAALLAPLAHGEADLVIGSRTLGSSEPGALLPQARFGNWLATTWIRCWYGFRYTDLGPFRAVRFDALERLAMRDRDWGWTIEMQVRALQEGLRVREVPVRYRRRVGRSKISGTLVGSLRAGGKILWMMWTLRRPARQDGR